MHKRRRTSSAASRQDEEMDDDDSSLDESPVVATGSVRKRKKMDPVSKSISIYLIFSVIG